MRIKVSSKKFATGMKVGSYYNYVLASVLSKCFVQYIVTKYCNYSYYYSKKKKKSKVEIYREDH